MMKTISLRFSDNFAPNEGTIAAHQALINERGYVWYGKMGSPVSITVMKSLLSQENTRVLLINSGKADRYWAHIADISRNTPDLDGIPYYYRNQTEKFKTWFKITRFESAPKDIMSHCFVASSGTPLSMASRHSMSPYFIINYNEE